MIDSDNPTTENNEKKLKDFVSLIEKIEYANEEIKTLWIEIYKNALNDRTYASILYVDLYKHVVSQDNGEGHQINGKNLSLYLEKMNKSNDQLLRLAELITEASGGPGDVDAESLYNEIAKK